MSITAADLRVRRVGEPAVHSPMARLLQGRASSAHYVHESDRVLLDDTVMTAVERRCEAIDLPSLEPGGPRRTAPWLTSVAPITPSPRGAFGLRSSPGHVLT